MVKVEATDDFEQVRRFRLLDSDCVSLPHISFESTVFPLLQLEGAPAIARAMTNILLPAGGNRYDRTTRRCGDNPKL
jgi:hypothetical protein